MPTRLILLALGLLLGTTAEAAPPTNGTYQLMHEGIVPAGGKAANAQYTLQGGEALGVMPQAPAPVTARVQVSGTTDDSSADIMVQGAGEEQVPAAIVGNTFTAHDVLLKLGPNTLTIRATDQAGNSSAANCQVLLDLAPQDKAMRFHYRVSGQTDATAIAVTVNGQAALLNQQAYTADIDLTGGLNAITAMVQDVAGNTLDSTVRVFVPLPTVPPAMPTIGTVGTSLPEVTTESEITVSGTTVPGTTVWVNGQQAILLDETTWTITLNLQEGDNIIRVVAKDALGASSAEAKRNVVVDRLPPVITIAATAKTNLSPWDLIGVVDDSLTEVRINGALAARTGSTFTLPLALVYGPNTVTIQALSPRQLAAAKQVTVTLGSVPTIQTVVPSDGRLLYQGQATTLQISSVDTENDPQEYRFRKDEAVLRDWGAVPTLSLTPAGNDLGAHLLTFEARDAYGGSDQQQSEVLVIREPVQPPGQP